MRCLHNPANVQQMYSKYTYLCWTFAGSCKHPIKVVYMLSCLYSADISTNSITPTLRLSLKLPRRESRGHKSWKSATQIMICCRLSWFVSQNFVICVRANFVANILTCRDGLCLRLSWFVSATFPMGKFWRKLA